MDARSVLLTIVFLSAWCSSGSAQVFVGPRTVVQTPNFRVYARSAQLANDIARVAEDCRKQLAIHWIGHELPQWPEQCPIAVNDGPNRPAEGETKYSLVPGGVANFNMSVAGTPERIMDSVLPHEITHTVIASHLAKLGKPVPRWADEGACTTVEHQSERRKHEIMLVQFLSQGKGIPFKDLFALENYPPDMMPLYAQGYSLSCFLIAQGGPRHFVKFLERGMDTKNWVAATEEFYGYPMLGKLQVAWNKWVGDGGGVVDNYTASSLGLSTRSLAFNAPANSIALAGATMAPRNDLVATAPTNPVQLASASSSAMSNRNNTMNTSSGSYYLDRLRAAQQNAVATNAGPASESFVPATQFATNGTLEAVPQVSSLPAPAQTIGGSRVWR